MATINYRLQKIASDLFIKYGSAEREDIDKKVQNLKTILSPISELQFQTL